MSIFFDACTYLNYDFSGQNPVYLVDGGLYPPHNSSTDHRLKPNNCTYIFFFTDRSTRLK